MASLSIQPNRFYPSIPAIAEDSASHETALRVIKEAVETHERQNNNYLKSFIRFEELIDLGIIDSDGNFTLNLTAGSVTSVFGRSGIVVAELGDYAAIAEVFTAKQTFPASVAGAASIQIQEGVAPTTPADGDVWVTTAGEFFAHLNGVSIDLAQGGISDGSVTDAMLRWTGAVWIEEAQIQASTAGVLKILDTALVDFIELSSTSSQATLLATEDLLIKTNDTIISFDIGGDNVLTLQTNVVRVNTDSGGFLEIRDDIGNNVHLTTSSSALVYNFSTNVKSIRYNDGISIVMEEKAAAEADLSDFGQWWVRNDTPNTPMFTTDTGLDRELVYVGGAFHDGFSDFVAQEHIRWDLTGGEDIHADRLSSGANMNDSVLDQPLIRDFGITHQVDTVSSNAVTVNLVNGNSHLIDMDPATADVVLTLSNPPASGRYGEVQLHIVMGTPAHGITWPGSVTWQGGGDEPNLTSLNNTVDVIHLYTIDGGTNWFGTFALAAPTSSGAEINDLSAIVTWANVPVANIPNLDAAKITSGAFDDARIPNLNTSKLTAGTLVVARGGTGVTGSTGSGNTVRSASPTFTGTVLGAALTFTGQVQGATLNASSDVRLKENLSVYLSRPLAFKAYHYDLKAGQKNKIGYLAHEVAKELPGAVITDKDGMLALDYNMVFVAKIAELEARLKAAGVK